ncbi:MAG: 3-deoxy-7-phosphoheptulonate synthase [Clostridia bacterium]|nr:3-deoxy-7-phosphoheptulonate synthase [Clostridia bacterium]
MNMVFKREMPTANVIQEMYPLTEAMREQKRKNDAAVQAIFTGESSRLLLIIGPCSADREDAVLEYIGRLRNVQEKVKDQIVIVPRIYTNKPRTTGDGYKGMLHQPDPTHSPDLLRGLLSIRKLHIDALEQTGFSCADEMLYPENHRYLADCLSYVAVGARSVENQLHRLTASGLDIPVGMKNPTGGDLQVMMNSIKAAQHSHTFVYSGWEVQSRGNAMAHAILRGYSNKHGQSVPNYHYEDLRYLYDLYQGSGLSHPAVIVDCNHANSGKQFDQQPRIAEEILHSMRVNVEIRSIVKGLMIESYLEDGCQKPEEGIYGKSITDPCLGWEKTERMIYDLAEKL